MVWSCQMIHNFNFWTDMQRKVTFGPGNLLICEYCNPHHFCCDNVLFHHTPFMHFPSAILIFRLAPTATKMRI